MRTSLLRTFAGTVAAAILGCSGAAAAQDQLPSYEPEAQVSGVIRSYGFGGKAVAEDGAE